MAIARLQENDSVDSESEAEEAVDLNHGYRNHRVPQRKGYAAAWVIGIQWISQQLQYSLSGFQWENDWLLTVVDLASLRKRFLMQQPAVVVASSAALSSRSLSRI